MNMPTIVPKLRTPSFENPRAQDLRREKIFSWLTHPYVENFCERLEGRNLPGNAERECRRLVASRFPALLPQAPLVPLEPSLQKIFSLTA